MKRKKRRIFCERYEIQISVSINKLLLGHNHANSFCYCCLVVKSCPTFFNPMTCSLPGSSVHIFPRQEYWNRLPFPSPRDPPDPGIEPTSPALPGLAGAFFTTQPPGKPTNSFTNCLWLLSGYSGKIESL